MHMCVYIYMYTLKFLGSYIIIYLKISIMVKYIVLGSWGQATCPSLKKYIDKIGVVAHSVVLGNHSKNR